MSVLAIDTSARGRIVCVLTTAAGELVDADIATGVPASVALPWALGRVLDRVDVAVVVVVGPGSYSGLRAGMAAALGVAVARGLPMHGVGTLDVIAAGAPLTHVARGWLAADAGRGGAYVARHDAPSSVVRVDLAGFDPGGLPVLSTDALGIDGLVPVDPVRALAAAVPEALTRPELDRTALAATYVDTS